MALYSHNSKTAAQGAQPTQAQPQPQQPDPQAQAQAAAAAAAGMRANMDQNNNGAFGNGTTMSWQNVSIHGSNEPQLGAPLFNPNQQNDQDGTWSFFDDQALAINANPAGQVINKLVEAFKKATEDNISKEMEMTILPLDNNNIPNLGISVIVICIRVKESDNDNSSQPVAHFSFILEGSLTTPIPNRVDTVNNNTYQVTQLASDAYDSEMRDIIARHVRRQFPKASMVLCGDATVVLASFEPTQENIYGLLVEAYQSCRAQLQQLSGNNVNSDLSRQKDQPVIYQQLIINNEGGDDGIGNPVRCDWLVTTYARKQHNQQQYQRVLNLNSTGKPITAAGGFINFQYAPSQSMPVPTRSVTGQEFLRRPQVLTQVVLTRLVNMTNQTLPGYLLALANATTILLEENIMALTGRCYTQGGNDTGRAILHDIGNMGVDIDVDGNNEFGAFSTARTTFSGGDLIRFFEKVVWEHPTLAIDAPECGVDSWKLMVFILAAFGDDQARELIRLSANILTGFRFDKAYVDAGGNGSFVLPNPTRIFLGDYPTNESTVDGRQKRRDIRDLDYLATCGIFGEKDPSVIRSYTEALYSPNVPWQKSLQDRETIMRQALPGLRLTGYAQRIEFEPAFLTALTVAVTQCNYRVSPPNSNEISITTDVTRYGAAGASGSILNMNAVRGILNTVQPNNGSQAFAGRFAPYLGQPQFSQQPYGQNNGYNPYPGNF